MRTESNNIPYTVVTKVDPVPPEAPGTPIHEDTVDPTPSSPRKKVVPVKANNAIKKKVSNPQS